MSDPLCSLKSAATVWALSLLPRAVISYTGLAFVLASTTVYLIHRQLPSEKLARLEARLDANSQVLEKAKKACRLRATRSLLELEERLLQVKRTVSEVKVRLLKSGETEAWTEYLQTIREIMQTISECGTDMKEIRTDILVIMEEETQRKLSEGVDDTRAALATIYLPTLHVPLNIRRRRGACPTRQESIV